jgi:tryptophanyl-tRNA synthetase
VTHNRVMSGMRPTGLLHVGHYLGVLTNWLRMQARYDCFFAIADWHMLTTGFAKTDGLRDNTRAMALDWLASGIDPTRATIYIQSAVPETAELHLLLSMVTPVNWLQRDPTLKDMVRELRLAEDNVSYGLLGYPALQTADILGVQANLVPVGADQLAHLEISRDIARRFNHLFQCDLFPEPQALLTETPTVLGTDGRKMSKSYHNDIKLSDDAKTVQQKVMTMVTDPARIRKDDPGHPEVCVVWDGWRTYHDEQAAEVAEQCRAGTIGCVQCKRNLASRINDTLAPIQAHRAELARDPSMLDDVLASGNQKARIATRDTLNQVRDAMQLNRYNN